jgi:hypothetical protein
MMWDSYMHCIRFEMYYEEYPLPLDTIIASAMFCGIGILMILQSATSERSLSFLFATFYPDILPA